MSKENFFRVRSAVDYPDEAVSDVEVFTLPLLQVVAEEDKANIEYVPYTFVDKLYFVRYQPGVSQIFEDNGLIAVRVRETDDKNFQGKAMELHRPALRLQCVVDVLRNNSGHFIRKTERSPYFSSLLTANQAGFSFMKHRQFFQIFHFVDQEIQTYMRTHYSVEIRMTKTEVTAEELAITADVSMINPEKKIITSPLLSEKTTRVSLYALTEKMQLGTVNLTGTLEKNDFSLLIGFSNATLQAVFSFNGLEIFTLSKPLFFSDEVKDYLLSNLAAPETQTDDVSVEKDLLLREPKTESLS